MTTPVSTLRRPHSSTDAWQTSRRHRVRSMRRLVGGLGLAPGRTSLARAVFEPSRSAPASRPGRRIRPRSSAGIMILRTSASARRPTAPRARAQSLEEGKLRTRDVGDVETDELRKQSSREVKSGERKIGGREERIRRRRVFLRPLKLSTSTLRDAVVLNGRVGVGREQPEPGV